MRSFLKKWRVFSSARSGRHPIPEGFDEATYLLLYPDVAAAVAGGSIESGLAHYLRFGRTEGRQLLATIPACLARLEARILAAESAVGTETTRLDWALGVCEGVTLQIELFHEARETPQYQSAFELSEPLVSVCVATMDRADMLVERAIRSLRAQTYRNLQIVVVGDHCLDDTGTKLSALRDDRIGSENLPERGPYPPPGPDRWRVAGAMP